MPAASGLPTKSPDERLPRVDETVISERTKRRYRIVAVIGDGGYGTVFEVTDELRKLAMKTEKYSRSMLHIELNVLKNAMAEKCKHIVEVVDHGIVGRDFCYVVMPLLGKDVHKLRNDQKDRRFTAGTAVRLGIQGLEALDELHTKCGFLSRDVKPGNFACGYPQSLQFRTLFLIDFGLARRYVDKNKNLLPHRREVGWRGTTRYGSLQAHLKQDLGRKDDVESWFYMLVEITKGALPWRTLTDRSAVHASKLSARTMNRTAFMADCPPEYNQILTHIDSMSFPDTPKYGEMISLLTNVLDRHHITEETPFDWEQESGMSSTRHSSMSDNEQRANPNDRLSKEMAQ